MEGVGEAVNTRSWEGNRDLEGLDLSVVESDVQDRSAGVVDQIGVGCNVPGRVVQPDEVANDRDQGRIGGTGGGAD